MNGIETVGQLKAALADISDDTIVVLSKDAEGNGYDTLYSVETGHNFSEGEIGYAEGGDNDPEDCLDGTPCVVLWP